MQLDYSADEILSEHGYRRPHVVAGQDLHGGFDAGGRYVSPRTRHRRPAIHRWGAALRARGGDLLAAQPRLFDGPRYPNSAQHRYLLTEELGWQVAMPDYQDVVPLVSA